MSQALDAGAVAELVDATRLFLQRHEEALLSAEPARLVEACDGLHHGLCTTLSESCGALHNALRAARPAPLPADPAEGLRLVLRGDPHARESWAFASVAKRLNEAEGALLHLRLTLSRGAADGPAASLPYARRVAGEVHTVHRTLAALLAALRAWADAYRAATGGPAPGHPTPSARDGLRAARDCLQAGVPEAAGPALAGALVAGLAAPFAGRPALADVDAALARWRDAGLEPPAPREAVRAAHEALLAGTRDPVVAWRLLDLVEHVVNQASMTRAP